MDGKDCTLGAEHDVAIAYLKEQMVTVIANQQQVLQDRAALPGQIKLAIIDGLAETKKDVSCLKQGQAELKTGQATIKKTLEDHCADAAKTNGAAEKTKALGMKLRTKVVLYVIGIVAYAALHLFLEPVITSHHVRNDAAVVATDLRHSQGQR